MNAAQQRGLVLAARRRLKALADNAMSASAASQYLTLCHRYVDWIVKGGTEPGFPLNDVPRQWVYDAMATALSELFGWSYRQQCPQDVLNRFNQLAVTVGWP